MAWKQIAVLEAFLTKDADWLLFDWLMDWVMGWMTDWLHSQWSLYYYIKLWKFLLHFSPTSSGQMRISNQLWKNLTRYDFKRTPVGQTARQKPSFLSVENQGEFLRRHAALQMNSVLASHRGHRDRPCENTGAVLDKQPHGAGHNAQNHKTDKRHDTLL